MRSTSEADRSAAIDRVVALGEKCVPWMVAALGAEEGSIRSGATRALRMLGPGIVPDLIERSHRSPVLIRVGIQRAVGGMTPRVSGDIVLDLIRDSPRDEEVVREAARSLYVPRTVSGDGLEYLRKLILDDLGCETGRALLAVSLGVQSPGDPLADSTVAAALLSSSATVRDEVVRTLWSVSTQIARKTVEALSRWLDDDRPMTFTWRRGNRRCVSYVRRQIAATAVLGKCAQVPASLPMEREGKPPAIHASLRLTSLLNWSAGLASTPLRDVVDEYEPDMKALFAYLALRRASDGCVDGIDWTVELLKDPADGVRCALTTVDRDVSERLVERLVGVLRTAGSPTSEVRCAAIILTRIGRYRTEWRGLAGRVEVELRELSMIDRASLVRSLAEQLEAMDSVLDSP